MIIAALRLLRSAIISTRQACIALAILLATALPVAAQSFTLTLQPNTIPSGTNGVAYNQLITAVGGNGPYTFAVTAGSLPPGIVLDSDGTLHGTPTTPNNYSFTITATDTNSASSGFRPYTFSIGTAGFLGVNPANLPNGTQGVAYSQTITVTNSSGGNVFSISSGSLPPGLSINSSTGVISGTPTTGGSFTFTVHVIDSDGDTGNRSYTVGIGTNSLTVNPASLPNGTQGVGYNQTVSASGGTGPYTFSVSAGSLPAGLNLNANTGVISGTPTGSGPSTFTIRAIDSIGNFGTRNYTVNIGTVSLTVNPPTLPPGAQGQAYSQTISASGGTGPYTFSVIAGSVPTGLSFNGATGVLSGTPTVGGTFNFTVEADDTLSNSGTRAYSLTINLAPLTVNPASLPPGSVGLAYNQTVVASGGTAPYSYTVLSGALPPGLTLNGGSGVIGGTPTAGGTFNFTVQATDSTPNTGTRAYSLNIGTNSLTVNPATLPAGTQGTAYNQTVSASGGAGPYTFALAGGALPAGLTLNGASGAISGTPTAGGLSNFTIRATDTNGNIGTRAYAVNIGTNSLTVNPPSLPPGSQGLAYSQTVTASGGTGPYTYTLIAGALPAGLSLNAATGIISGTPTGGGVSNFTIQALDASGNTGSRAYNVNIGTSILTVNPTTLPAASRGIAYSQTVTATGGTGPYNFFLAGGALPPGLTLNQSTGVISGTPTGSGVSNFTIRAVDVNGNTGTRAYTVNTGTDLLVLNPPTLPNAPQGSRYSQKITATGGNGTYTFALTAGALPPGLTLDPATGAITGTPTSIGSFTFTIQAHDTNGNTGRRAYTIGTARLDPTLDPDVRGLVAAQAATARRFADTQVTNVSRHLEGLHGDYDPCAVDVGILTPDAPARNYNDPVSVWLPQSPNNSPAGQVARRSPGAAADCANRAWWMPAIAIWAAGSMDFGGAGATSVLSQNKFSTGGLTAGGDIRVFERLIIGAAFGYGADHTDIGQVGTHSGANSFSGVFYASYKPVDGWFVDAILGFGSLGFNNSRMVPLDGVAVAGTRSGSYWVGSISAGPEFKFDAFMVSPYLRADYMSARLGTYAEQGPTVQALTFDGVRFNSTAVVLGVRGAYDIPSTWGVLTPSARLEYRHAVDGAFTQSMFYNDIGSSVSYALAEPSASRNQWTGALGLRVRAGLGTSLEFEYSATASAGASVTQGLRAIGRYAF